MRGRRHPAIPSLREYHRGYPAVTFPDAALTMKGRTNTPIERRRWLKDTINPEVVRTLRGHTFGAMDSDVYFVDGPF
jgi:hypothetical protein